MEGGKDGRNGVQEISYGILGDNFKGLLEQGFERLGAQYYVWVGSLSCKDTGQALDYLVFIAAVLHFSVSVQLF